MKSHDSTHVSLTKKIILGFLGWILFVAFLAAGIYDIIDPFILGDHNSTIGYILAILGLIFPYVWAKFIARWDKRTIWDFFAYSYAVFISILLIVGVLILPQIGLALYFSAALTWSLTLIGALLIWAGAYILLKKSVKKVSGKRGFFDRIGGLCLLIGNALFFIGIYYVIGRGLVK